MVKSKCNHVVLHLKTIAFMAQRGSEIVRSYPGLGL